MSNTTLNEKSFSLLHERIAYLEEVNRFTNNALDLAMSLGDFPTSFNRMENAAAILAESAARVKRLVTFQAIAFFLVDEESSDFYLASCEPQEMSQAMTIELDHLIDKGLMAWAMGRKKSFFVPSRTQGRQMLVHSISTTSRVRGIFVGFLDEDMREIPDSSLLLLSIVMLNTANTLESYELYRWIANVNQDLEKNQAHLEELVVERTQKLEGANLQLKNEIKERKKVEDALKRAHATLEEKVEERSLELKESYRQLAHAGRLTALGEMATGIAHEINQPLTVIGLGADVLLKYIGKNEYINQARETVEKIRSQVARAAKIINNMRAFARSSPEKLHPIDLLEPVSQAISFFREQLRLHNILLKEIFPPELPKIKLDAQKIEQIVVNFLSNARYAVDKKGETAPADFRKEITVRLLLHPEREEIALEVEDNGIGMTPEEQDRCFEPFFTTKEVGLGTGLGLSIIHGLVKEFNGRIEVRSRLDEGCLFRIMIPLKLAEPAPLRLQKSK